MGTPELGFGIMRMPQQDGKIDWLKSEELIDEYMKGDFCYFDTHPSYMLSQSQRIINEFVVKKYDRSRFLLADKMPYYGIKAYHDYEDTFEQELAACGVDYFDYYLLHAITQSVYDMHERLGGFRFLNEIKREGRARNIGISFHDKAELLEAILTKHPEIDFVQLQINYLDWEDPVIQARACHEIARKYQKEIIVMEPVKGGSLAREDASQEYAKMALQFVGRLPGIRVILSGMAEIEHIRENRVTLSEIDEKEPIDFAVYQNLADKIRQENVIPCTKCEYCVRECPQGVRIPEIFALINTYSRPGIHDRTIYGRMKMLYTNTIRNKGAAGKCIDCGMCERRCPQKISIRQHLRKAANMFEKKYYYTSERTAQILIYLMREYGIRKIIASPGTMNAPIVYSAQQDDFFEVYSAPDERSAAYMACGLAVESGEVVALSCTGATASRNYIPGLTEAYYRNIPVLAITSSQPISRIGHNSPQMIDRTRIQNDIARMSVEMPTVRDNTDEWNCVINANKAINELWHNGKGPVHINLIESYKWKFSAKTLPEARVIRRIQQGGEFPDVPAGKLAIFCGAHRIWDEELVEKVDLFCEQYGVVVICDHTSNYAGRFRYTPSFLESGIRKSSLEDIDLLIHMGDISGAYFPIKPRAVWRVHPDGRYCDTYKSLSCVFEMSERAFFDHYTEHAQAKDEQARMVLWPDVKENGRTEPSEMPFSNAWIASRTAHKLPENAVLHLGILNSLRVWNYYRVPESVRVYSNTGGFGIDGCLSTLIGASLADPDKLYFGVLGDLAFFYDMNSLGNRHIGNNIRLLVINNGCGTEFKNYSHPAYMFGDQADAYIAAKGHYGAQSKRLLKDYAENLGFLYRSAGSKEEYLEILPELLKPETAEKSMVVEIFTDSEAESDVLKLLNGISADAEIPAKKTVTAVPKWFENLPEKEIVLWGCGKCFTRNLPKVERLAKVRYVCDNNDGRWNTEIVPGILCISPDELKKKKDIFVVIMLENAKVGFQIAQQLQMLGIDCYDLWGNWSEYASKMKWKAVES